MELHPFSPKRLECVKTVSLKQRNCQSLAWKWVLAMCELCQGREGGKPRQAASSPPTVPNLFTFCSASYLPWFCLQDQCFNKTESKSFGVTERWQQLGGINHKLLLLVERQVCIVIYLGFPFFSGAEQGNYTYFQTLRKK